MICNNRELLFRKLSHMTKLLNAEQIEQAEKFAMSMKYDINIRVNGQLFNIEFAENQELLKEFKRDVYKNLISYLLNEQL